MERRTQCYNSPPFPLLGQWSISHLLAMGYLVPFTLLIPS